MRALDEGQKVAHEVVADRRSGGSSGDNLKRRDSDRDINQFLESNQHD
jgi:hypothetical protein